METVLPTSIRGEAPSYEIWQTQPEESQCRHRVKRRRFVIETLPKPIPALLPGPSPSTVELLADQERKWRASQAIYLTDPVDASTQRKSDLQVADVPSCANPEITTVRPDTALKVAKAQEESIDNADSKAVTHRTSDTAITEQDGTPVIKQNAAQNATQQSITDNLPSKPL